MKAHQFQNALRRRSGRNAMTPEQIDEMRADMEAGTPGPWTPTNKGTFAGITHEPTRNNPIGGLVAKMHSGRPELPADHRRIARVPHLEAEVLRLREELEHIAEAREREIGATQ